VTVSLAPHRHAIFTPQAVTGRLNGWKVSVIFSHVNRCICNIFQIKMRGFGCLTENNRSLLTDLTEFDIIRAEDTEVT
jgi:hypothetical protein